MYDRRRIISAIQMVNGNLTQEFDQFNYSSRANRIIAKVFGKGSRIKVTSNHDWGDEMCYGISLLFLEYNFDVNLTCQMLSKSEGKGKARGYMNLQMTAKGLNKLGKAYSRQDMLAGETKVQSASSSANVAKLILSRKYKTNIERTIETAIQLANYIKTSKSSFFYFGANGRSFSHALAIRKTPNTLDLFDPNVGVISFSAGATGNTRSFATAVINYLSNVYSTADFYSYEIVGFSEKLPQAA